jgi:hypothetical protein
MGGCLNVPGQPLIQLKTHKPETTSKFTHVEHMFDKYDIICYHFGSEIR